MELFTALKISPLTTTHGQPCLRVATERGDVILLDPLVCQTLTQGTSFSCSPVRRGGHMIGTQPVIRPASPAPASSSSSPTAFSPSHMLPPAPKRAPLHGLTETELTALYDAVLPTAETGGDLAYLGQISNQIRYARMEALLTAIRDHLIYKPTEERV